MNKELTATINDIVKGSAQTFVDTLSKYQWSILPDSQLQAAKQALSKSDYIAQIACQDVDAVHDSLIKAAILGLDLTEGKRQGWLVPRKNGFGKTVIQLQVGYKGVEAIHQRMGVIERLSVRVVYEKDTFEWSGDDQEKPAHQADWLSSDRGNPKGAFIITYFPDSTFRVNVASIDEIYSKHRAFSDSYKTYERKLKEFESGKGSAPFPPPWVTHEQAMIEKTMAYIASRQWPAHIRDEGVASKILETLHEVDASDYSMGYTKEQKAAFDELREFNDALGLRLFQSRVGIEVYSRLFLDWKASIPRGDKIKQATALDKLAETGVDMLDNIEDAISNEDIGLLHENLEGITDIGKRMLMSHLGKEDSATMIRMIGE